MTTLILEGEQAAARRLIRLLHDIDPAIRVGPVLESVADASRTSKPSPTPICC